MRSFIDLAEKEPQIELQLVVGGGAILPRYGKISTRADKQCFFLVEGGTPHTMAKSAGLAVVEFANAFDQLKPDAVVAIADRFEVLSIAMAATYMNVPLIHVEGGEISGSIDESIRHAATKMAHLHFPASQEAADRIIRLGEPPETVFNVGATSIDALCQTDLDDLSAAEEFQEKTGVGEIIDFQDPYIIVIHHPVTTEYGSGAKEVEQIGKAVIKSGLQAVWVWPNFDAGSEDIAKAMREFREKTANTYFVRFFTGIPIEVYGPLLKHASCIVGNSSSGLREAAYLGTPCVNIGSRQDGRYRGKNAIDVECGTEAVKAAISRQIGKRYEKDPTYGDGHAAEKMAGVIRDYNFTVQKRLAF